MSGVHVWFRGRLVWSWLPDRRWFFSRCDPRHIRCGRLYMAFPERPFKGAVCEMLDLTDVDAVRAFVDDVISWGSGDPERAHSDEDELLRLVANTYAPAQIQSELARLAAADFPRWCA